MYRKKYSLLDYEEYNIFLITYFNVFIDTCRWVRMYLSPPGHRIKWANLYVKTWQIVIKTTTSRTRTTRKNGWPDEWAAFGTPHKHVRADRDREGCSPLRWNHHWNSAQKKIDKMAYVDVQSRYRGVSRICSRFRTFRKGHKQFFCLRLGLQK